MAMILIYGAIIYGFAVGIIKYTIIPLLQYFRDKNNEKQEDNQMPKWNEPRLYYVRILAQTSLLQNGSKICRLK